MKNYSRKNAKKGKLAYRTPDKFRYRQYQDITKRKSTKLNPPKAVSRQERDNLTRKRKK